MANRDLELQSPDTDWGIDNERLRALNVNKDTAEIEQLGGLEGIAKLLRTDLVNGIGADEIDDHFARRQAKFGDNVLVEPPMVTLWDLVLNALKEAIIILLIVAAIVSLVLGIVVPPKGSEKTGWIEGAAIIIAVFLVVTVTAGNDYSKELKFRALNKQKNDRLVKLRRAGKEETVSINTVQVGDIIILDNGDQIPADGLFVDGHELSADESTMTGETDAVKKNKVKPYMLSGCQVATGNGTMIITAVGMNSEWGITYKELAIEPEPTPMQEKLADLAKLIGYIGMGVAAVLFLILTLRFIITHATSSEKFEAKSLRDFINFLILCVTIIVVAVPEGLPLAVTIALAYSQKAMVKDNLLVRHMAACETMGGATSICSDKTGTLTENLMTVTNVWLGGKVYNGELEETLGKEVDRKTLELLATSCDANSTGFLRDNPEKKKQDFIGSKTECALLVLSNKLGYNYAQVRKAQKVITVFPFSSDRKRMSTLVDYESGSRLFTKGASEIILGLCDDYVDANGKIVRLTEPDVENLKKLIDELASEGLRTLTIAYRDLEEKTETWAKPPEESLHLIAIVGIKDPLRKEVPVAIEQCKAAGITVRMVTGDNKLTATRIATDCGILEEGHIVLEGPDFRKMSDHEIDAILPKLRVLARSSPTDKLKLVNRLRYHREVVAVTGDGTNDGPALKAADVGFAMGIAGTEIAKEASDIIVMDDNFASIVKAVMWGRCVRGNVQKFLQFQMTVNAVALVIAFIAAVSGQGEPLTPIQLLFVNLIQDTFAALALATEKPTDDLLKQRPTGRRERLITPLMWRYIAVSSIYSLAILLTIVYAGGYMFNITEDAGVDFDIHEGSHGNVRFTIVYNAFVLMACFNEINARRLDNKWNAFEGFFTNWIFVSVIIGTCIAQAIIVSVGSVAFQVIYLNYKYWFICLAIGLSMLPLGVINRVLIPVPDYDFIKYERPKKKKKGSKGSDSDDDDATKEVSNSELVLNERSSQKEEKMSAVELP